MQIMPLCDPGAAADRSHYDTMQKCQMRCKESERKTRFSYNIRNICYIFTQKMRKRSVGRYYSGSASIVSLNKIHFSPLIQFVFSGLSWSPLVGEGASFLRHVISYSMCLVSRTGEKLMLGCALVRMMKSMA